MSEFQKKAEGIFARFAEKLSKVDLKMAVSVPAVLGAATAFVGYALEAQHGLDLLKHGGIAAYDTYKDALSLARVPITDFMLRGVEGKLPWEGANTEAAGMTMMSVGPLLSAASVTLARGFQKIRASLHKRSEQMRREDTQAVVAAEPAPVDEEGRYTWAKNRTTAVLLTNTVENDMRAMTNGVAYAVEHPETPPEVREYLRKPLETAMRADVNGGPERLSRHHYQQMFHAVAMAGDFLNSAPDHFGRLPKVVDQKLFAAFNSATSPTDVNWDDFSQTWRHATYTEMREPPGTVEMLRRIALAHRVNVLDLDLRGDKVVLNTTRSAREHAAQRPWSNGASPFFRPICEVNSPFWRETERQVYILNRYAREHGLNAGSLYVRDDVVYEENPDAFVDRKVCDVNSREWDEAHRQLIREELRVNYDEISLENRTQLMQDSPEEDSAGPEAGAVREDDILAALQRGKERLAAAWAAHDAAIASAEQRAQQVATDDGCAAPRRVKPRVR
ncbi:hypothetical protein [Trinickia sp. EG282A]|uniref:hypothetical protein n=1 Tax=Trinickia sp. EG282A TaxID=3237013 RepID=UPI0034D36C2B